MKILEINSVCGIRSTGRICVDIGELAKKNGHEYRVAYGREHVPLKFEKYSIRIGTKVNYLAHAALSRLVGYTGFYSYWSTKKFLKWVDKYKPDLIHLHNIHGYYVNINLMFKYIKQKDIPCVWTLHDCWPFTGHCAYFSAINCNKWLDGCKKCHHKNAYPSCFGLEKTELNYLKKKEIFTGVKNMVIVTPSQWLGDLARKSFLNEYEIKVIPNGIDLNIFKPKDISLAHYNKNKTIILGCASSWNKNRGLEDFFKLRSKLDNRYELIIVGLTKKQISKLPAGIIGIERTNNLDELVELYSISDYLLNPTYEDNFPTINIESLACGTPVITYRTGGSPESIDERCGGVVEIGDVEALVNMISNNHWDTDECVKKALSYDKWKMFKNYISLYETMVQGSSDEHNKYN